MRNGTDFDVIVVGARCAGAPTAMLVAREGYRVALLDRAGFPSDKLSAPYLHSAGATLLARWGLLDRLRATGSPVVHRVLVDFGDGLEFLIDHEDRTVRLRGVELSTLPPDDRVSARAPRRIVLDQLLIDAAREAGATFLPRHTVTGVLWGDGRVRGVSLLRPDGTKTTLRAHAVVGADGVNSIVARAVAAPMTVRRPRATCAYYGYFADVDVDGMEVHLREGMAIMALATHGELTHVGISWPRGDFDRVRADPMSAFNTAIEAAPGLAERIHDGRPVERLAGTGNLPNYFRQPVGPGWALAGDAGYAHDPMTGLGISDAFRDAELIATGLCCHLRTGEPVADALGEFERRRAASSAQPFDLATTLAELRKPTLETLMLMATAGHIQYL